MSKSVLKRLEAQKTQNIKGVSGIKGCKCDFRTYMLGDGCDKCNPELALEYARENVEELEQQLAELFAAAKQTIEENGYLADGDNCTLKVLRDAVEKIDGVK